MDEEQETGKAAVAIVLGEDLARLSIDELEERIRACESEIARVREAIAAKQRSQADASAFFRT